MLTKQSKVPGLFDLLGFASLVVVCAKLILQDMWMKGLNWDDAIHHELSN